MKYLLILTFLLSSCALVVADQASKPESKTSPSTPGAEPSSANSPQPSPTATPFVFQKSEVKIKDFSIKVEVATSSQETARGLMHRSSMPPEEGMIFVFEPPRFLSFWMKNTLIPLSIAYADKEGKIISIREMKPLSEELHPSGGVARYALEMNKGWFDKNGIKVGDTLILKDSQKWVERAKNK